MASNSCSSDIFHGYVETPSDALQLIHAASQGFIPRVTRRLDDTERKSLIKSGAVFIFSVEESGIKRWTDGRLWSPYRIIDNFLVYHEIYERANNRGSYKLTSYTALDSSLGYKRDMSRRNQGSLLKPNRLIKKAMTVTIESCEFRLVSYCSFQDMQSEKFKTLSRHPDIKKLSMPPLTFRPEIFKAPKVLVGRADARKPRCISRLEEQYFLDRKREYGNPLMLPAKAQSPVNVPSHLELISARMDPAASACRRQKLSVIPHQAIQPNRDICCVTSTNGARQSDSGRVQPECRFPHARSKRDRRRLDSGFRVRSGNQAAWGQTSQDLRCKLNTATSSSLRPIPPSTIAREPIFLMNNSATDQPSSRRSSYLDKDESLGSEDKKTPRMGFFLGSKEFSINGGEYNAVNGNMQTLNWYRDESNSVKVYNNCVFFTVQR